MPLLYKKDEDKVLENVKLAARLLKEKGSAAAIERLDYFLIEPKLLIQKIAIYEREGLIPSGETHDLCELIRTDYTKSYKDKRKRMDNQVAVAVVGTYVDSSIKTVDQVTFDNYVKIVKSIDPELYRRYVVNEELSKKALEDYILKVYPTIFELVDRGIQLQDGRIRNFDLIDYYRLVGVDLNRFMNVVQSVYKGKERSQRIPLETFKVKFFSKYQEPQNLTEEKVLHDYFATGIKYDQDNKPIPGTGHVYTPEEKELIINFIKANNAPLNSYTYRDGIKRMENGYLLVDALTDTQKRR